MSRPNVNGKVDKWVPVSQIKMNPLNAEVYNKNYASKNEEYITGLMDSIIEKGLDKLMRTYDDGVTLIDGHHRYLGLLKAMFSEVPVEVTDVPVSDITDNPLGTMELLARNNMTHANLYSDWERWLSASKYKEKFKEVNGYEITMAEYTDYGKAISFSWFKNKEVKKLLEGYTYTIPKGKDRGTEEWIYPRCGDDGKSDLIGRLIKDEHSINHCVSTQLKDHFINKAETQRPFLDVHTDLDLEKAVRNVLKNAQKYVQAVKGYTDDFYGEEITLGANQDANVLTGMLHGGVTKLLPTALKHELGIDSEAPDFGSHFDVVAKAQPETGDVPWELEVKTSAGLNERWTTGSVKTGYNLLVRSDSDFTRFFAAFVYVPETYMTLDKDSKFVRKDCWVGSGGMFTTRKLDKNCLFRLINPIMPMSPDSDPVYGKVLVGDIEFTSREGVTIHTEKLG